MKKKRLIFLAVFLLLCTGVFVYTRCNRWWKYDILMRLYVWTEEPWFMNKAHAEFERVATANWPKPSPD